MEISLIIADDHPIVRQGLRRIIETDAAFAVLAEAGNGREALEAVEKYQPKIAVLDVDMPEKDGFETAREIFKTKYEIEIVFLTFHRDEDIFSDTEVAAETIRSMF